VLLPDHTLATCRALCDQHGPSCLSFEFVHNRSTVSIHSPPPPPPPFSPLPPPRYRSFASSHTAILMGTAQTQRAVP
jgi:hypothetical protein